MFRSKMLVCFWFTLFIFSLAFAFDLSIRWFPVTTFSVFLVWQLLNWIEKLKQTSSEDREDVIIESK